VKEKEQRIINLKKTARKLRAAKTKKKLRKFKAQLEIFRTADREKIAILKINISRNRKRNVVIGKTKK
jgi:hypothetical protein